jgi:hypothetical protein
VQDGDDRLRRLLGREALDRGRDDDPGAGLPHVLCLAFDVADADGGVPPGLVLDRRDELGSGRLGAEPGGTFQHQPPLVLQPLELGACPGQAVVLVAELPCALLEVARLCIEPGLALGDALLAPFEVLALLARVVASAQRDERHGKRCHDKQPEDASHEEHEPVAHGGLQPFRGAGPASARSDAAPRKGQSRGSADISVVTSGCAAGSSASQSISVGPAGAGLTLRLRRL